jgi:transcription initiation factor TFIIH subunit 2
MLETDDFKPSRISATVSSVESFIEDFFDQNPLSQIGIILSRNSIAEKITELGGNPSKQIKSLREQLGNVEGESSLQNSLELARASLKYCKLITISPIQIDSYPDMEQEKFWSSLEA